MEISATMEWPFSASVSIYTKQSSTLVHNSFESLVALTLTFTRVTLKHVTCMRVNLCDEDLPGIKLLAIV